MNELKYNIDRHFEKLIIITKIDELNNSKNTVPELEVRFNDNYIKRDAFRKTFDIIKKKNGVQKTDVQDISIGNLLNKQIRIIKEKDREDIYMKKEKISSVILSYMYFIKLTYSIETTMKHDPSKYDANKKEGKRTRERVVKKIRFGEKKEYLFEVFFTIVNETKYEIEVELPTEKINKSNFREVASYLYDIVNSIKNKYYYFSRYSLTVNNYIKNIHPPISFSKPEIFKYSKLFNDIKKNKLVNDKYVTYKLDGERKLLVLYKDEMYTYDEVNSIIYIKNINPENEYKLTIFDTEFYENIYYIFDAIVIDDSDIRNENFRNRLDQIESFDIECIKDQVKLKEYKAFNNYNTLYKSITYLYENYKGKYNMDGLIFSHLNKNYNYKQYKWKWNMTIDMKVINKKLYSTSSDKGMQIHDRFVIQNYSKSLEGKICEFEVLKDSNTLVYIKTRDDKRNPNSEYVVNDTINNINNNMNINDILGITPYLFRKSCNNIKKEIIKKLNGIVVDIGSGRGSDIYKILPVNVTHQKIKELHCIEPNKENYAVLRDLVNKHYSNISERIYTYQNYSHSKSLFNNLAERIPIIENITMFFVINQIKPSDIEITVRNILKISNQNTKVHIIMLCKDELNKILKKRQKKNIIIENNGELILKIMPYINKGIEYNEIYLGGPTSSNIQEYSYSREYIVNCFSKVGFKVKKHHSLNSKNFILSKIYIDILSTYYYYCFSLC
ncbi:hypothetical protein HDU92_007764 [Lobulomyces angularis]|nr:hypothetical protein HDU92_007764 [Lobulomyces angularis]